jgi:tetratricopeptide (TPR) repeat protein
MAVKRVTESYTKGSLAGARRPPQSIGARTPTLAPALPRPPAPKATSRGAGTAISENVIAAIAADIAALHQVAPSAEPPVQPPAPAPHPAPHISETSEATAAIEPPDLQTAGKSKDPPAVDYRDIVANTVATLEHNTAETRHAVYECAREVVYQRLTSIRPAVSPELVARERASLDRAINEIEAEAVETQAATAPSQDPASQAAAKPIEPVVISPPHRSLPQAKHHHGGALRLFAIVGLVCAGIFVYWLVAGRPEIKSPVAYLPALPGSAAVEKPEPLASQQTASSEENSQAAQPAAPDSGASDSPPDAVMPAAPQPNAATGNIDTNETARALAANPLINFNVDCGGAPCANSQVSAPPATGADSASWIASYGAIKSPTNPGQIAPQNSRETAKLLDAGRAAAAPSAENSFARGMDKSRNGDSDGAIRDFSEAIRLNPNYADAFVQRGNARFKNGNPDLAITDFSDAIGIDARNAAAFKARGMARLYNADEESALEDLSKAIQIAESEAARLPVIDLFFARRTRAGIYSRRRTGDRELFDLSAMVDAYWKNPDLADALKGNYGVQGAASLMATIYRQRATLYVQRANTDGAVADLSLALQLDPARAVQLMMERARIQEAAGKREQAAADFQRVLQVNPRIEEAKQAVARLNARP